MSYTSSLGNENSKFSSISDARACISMSLRSNQCYSIAETRSEDLRKSPADTGADTAS